MKRYQKLPNYKNIRKDLSTSKYEAYKTINGKRYSEHFERISDAQSWLREFHPGLKAESAMPFFSECYTHYLEAFQSTLELSSQDIKKQRMAYFLPYIQKLRLDEITPPRISQIITQLKTEASGKRFNFNDQLKELRAVLNWILDHYDDSSLKNPVRKFHFRDGVIKKSPKMVQKLSLDQVKLFLSCIDDLFYRDVAIFQFLTASRISEVAGLQKSDVDLKNGSLTIQNVVMWARSKQFLGLKPYTKNGSEKLVKLSHPELASIVSKYLLLNHQSQFLFSPDGQALSYRKVQHQYRKALKKAGLTVNGSTHFLRHSMATITRSRMGSIDAVKAVTGHQDTKMAEHYGHVDNRLQEESLSVVANEMFAHQNVQECVKGVLKV